MALFLPHLSSLPALASLTINQPLRPPLLQFVSIFDPFLFKMQTKGFLPSFLATFLSVGVIATPTGVEPRDIKSTHGWDGAVTSFEEVAIAVGDRNPRSNGRIITPKDNDVPVVSTSVEARDPVGTKLPSINSARRIVTNLPKGEFLKENRWVYFRN